jgi:DNA repair and recombination protein RAD52
MTFTTKQIEDLAAPLQRSNVQTRRGGRDVLPYVESHHVIREANRIFGFDGWSSETVDLRCVSEQQGVATYLARVRVTVFAGERMIVREGVGACTARGPDAHENGAKGAESDAQKRALRQFGDQFGLALYDKEQTHVSDNPGASSKADATSSRAVGASAEQGVQLPRPGPTVSERVYAPLPDPRIAALERRAAKMNPEESATALELLRVALDACTSLDDLRDFSTKNRDTIDMLTDDHVRTLRYEAQQMRGTLKARAAA